jgi:hypothetical protein
MSEFAQCAGFRRLLWLSIALCVVIGSLHAQAAVPRAVSASEPKTFVEITSRLGLPATGNVSGVPRLPISIRSDEYSLEYARRNVVPAIGGSIAIGDFDGDGHPDLYVIVPGGSNHLFQRRADGTFADVTEKAKVAGSGADLAGAFADFDKSGHASLFVAGLGGVTLYHNNGDGTFTDTTQRAGLKRKPGELATSVLLFDADNDGFLDLLVTVYSDLSAPPAKKTFVFPNDFGGANSRLYHNQHDGTFVDVTESAGLTSNPGRTRNAVAADFNRAGRLDLLLLRDDKPPVLYRNQGKGLFEDRTWEAGTEIWKYAYVDGQAADFNRDGKTDVVLWSTIGNEVLLNQGNGKFKQDESLPLVYAANRAFGFHGMVADFDDDGYEDLLTVDDRGHWHFIVNHAGKFEEAAFVLSPQTRAPGGPKSDSAGEPLFAFLAAARLGSANKLNLVGLTMDGQVHVFESRPGGAIAHQDEN